MNCEKTTRVMICFGHLKSAQVSTSGRVRSLVQTHVNAICVQERVTGWQHAEHQRHATSEDYGVVQRGLATGGRQPVRIDVLQASERGVPHFNVCAPGKNANNAQGESLRPTNKQ